MSSTPTFWNGEPCEAQRLCVIVGDTGRFAEPWFKDYVGCERPAVEVTYDGHTFYIDNEYGAGWLKVTTGKGSPLKAHRSLDVDRIVA